MTGQVELTTKESELNGFLRKVRRGHENALEIIKEALPEGQGNKFTLEMRNREIQREQAPHPVRMESQRRCHIFHDANTMARYLLAYGGEKTVILADTENMRISAVLNEEEEKGREVVIMEARVHPLWKPWEDALAKPMRFGQFCDQITENRRSIVGDSRALLMTLAQIRMSSEVSVYVGEGANSMNGILVKTKVAGAAHETPAELPEEIRIDAPLFIGTESVEIVIDITIKAGRPDEEPTIRLTSSDAEMKKIEAFESLLSHIAEGFTSGVSGLGETQYNDWDYIGDE